MPITPRNRTFSDDVPQYWFDGERAITIFFDNLSILFPEGERFFIEAVRAHAPQVKDAQLQQDVRGFITQEGAHSREHIRYNQRLARFGYPVKQLERGVKWILNGARRRLPKRWALSATCALEHYTASLGHMLLSYPEVLGRAHPEMARLWKWHAQEEIEHKGVAWDVYRASGGSYAERVFIMLWTTVIFWIKVAEQQWRMMRAAGLAGDRAEWMKLLRFLYVEPGPMRHLVPMYLDYFRAGFHPWNLDDAHLVADAAQDSSVTRVA